MAHKLCCCGHFALYWKWSCLKYVQTPCRSYTALCLSDLLLPVLCFQRVREDLPFLFYRESKTILMTAFLSIFLWFRCAIVLRLEDRKERKDMFSLIIYWSKISNLKRLRRCFLPWPTGFPHLKMRTCSSCQDFQRIPTGYHLTFRLGQLWQKILAAYAVSIFCSSLPIWTKESMC